MPLPVGPTIAMLFPECTFKLKFSISFLDLLYEKHICEKSILPMQVVLLTEVFKSLHSLFSSKRSNNLLAD